MSDAQTDTSTTTETSQPGERSKLDVRRETLATCAEGGGPQPDGGSSTKGGREEGR